MSGEAVCLAVLLCGGAGPAVVVVSRGEPLSRLIGLELLSAVVVLAMLLESQLSRTYELIVPLVLVPLSFAGTLVFTRLLRP